jgi:hypothetical protein
MLEVFQPVLRRIVSLAPSASNGDRPQQAFPTPPASESGVNGLRQDWVPAYQPEAISHVTRAFPDRRVNLKLVVYLPTLAEGHGVEVQVKLSKDSWRSLHPPEPGQNFLTLHLERIPAKALLKFRYRDTQGDWQPLYPLGESYGGSGMSQVPQLHHVWQHDPPRQERGRVLLETTLEGLLAGYKGGSFFPRSLEELQEKCLSDRLLATEIPERLATWGIDEIMCPIWASVANRAYLNPKFNYLISNVGGVDWQIGQGKPLIQLVDRSMAAESP